METEVDNDVEAPSVIDEKIVEHEAAIHALKLRRNTQSAIAKMPAELFAKIFVLAQHYARQAKTGDSKDRNWLNVSFVCRQWRDIVLETPWLWRTIDLSWKAERAFEFLKRSKSVPLQVRCRSHYFDGVRFGPIAKAVFAQRIQGLHIPVNSLDSLIQLLELNPSGSAPTLEVLRLKAGRALLPIPLPALWQDMPALRVLELDNISLSSPLPMLPHLARLVLQSRGFLPTETWPASWLIRSLRHTPLIEEIDISGLSDQGFEGPSSQILLPKLTSLRIKSDGVGMSKIFDYIDFPVPAMVAFLSPLLGDTEFSSLERLCSRFAVEATSTAQVCIGVRAIAFDLRFMPSSAESSPYLHIMLPVPQLNTVAPYVQLCSALPLATVRTLTLSGFQNTPITQWLPLFSFFQQLTTIELIKCGRVAVVGLLKTDNAQRPPLETLETIVMNHVSFYLPDNSQSDDEFCDAVIHVLTQRKELGVPIQKLKVEKCHISYRVVEAFMAHVEVDWDGLDHDQSLREARLHPENGGNDDDDDPMDDPGPPPTIITTPWNFTPVW